LIEGAIAIFLKGDQIYYNKKLDKSKQDDYLALLLTPK
jgi:hypothetical protein